MEQSHQPISKVLVRLLEDEGISQRELARRCARHKWGGRGKKGLSMPAISMIARGEFTPSIDAMEAIGKALQVPPETFAEYRLAKARAELDPDKVGLRKALRNLESR